MSTASLIAPEHETAFRQAAKQFDVFILVRAANPKSFRFYNKKGYYPKRLDIKAKTAKLDVGKYILAGLVVSPEIHPGAFGDRDPAGVKKNWQQSLEKIYIPQAGKPMPAYLPGGKLYSVEMDPNHEHYGALFFTSYGLATKKLFVCGDYDLYGLISAKNPSVHHFVLEKMIGADHTRSPELRDVQYFLNRTLGMPLIQHGAQESFLEHQEEPVLVFEPGGRVHVLPDKASIEKFYAEVLHGRKTFDLKHGGTPQGGPGMWKRA